MLLAALVLASSAAVAYAVFVATTTNSGNSVAAAATFDRCLVDEVMSDSPRAYWRLDDTGSTLVDRTGQNNGGYSAAVVKGQAGALGDPANRSVELPGSAFAQAPSSASLRTGDTFTYEAWIKLDAVGTGSNRAVFIAGQGTSGSGPYLRIGPSDTLILSATGVTLMLAESTVSIRDTKWHHVAATKSGSQVRLYIDGVDRTRIDTAHTFGNYDGPFQMGSSSANFNGHIDEAAVFGTALSAARIRAHYNSGRCYRDEPRADGAQAQWRLGEAVGAFRAFDSLGTDHAGVAPAGPTLGAASLIDGDSNTAATFGDQTGDEITVGDRFDFAGTSAFTAEAWVKRGPRNQGHKRIFDKAYSEDSDPQGGWAVYVDWTTQRLAFKRGSTRAIGTTSMNAGEIYHVVASYDGSTMRVYVNGKLEGFTASAASLPGNAIPLRIGSSEFPGSLDQFQGTIDEAAIYSGALSAQRVADHYIAGRSYRDAVLDDAPFGYWRLGESSGTAAAAATGSNAGTYSGSPTLGRSGLIAGDGDLATDFDGSNDNVVIANESAFDMGAGSSISLEAWVLPTTLSTSGDGQIIIGKGANSGVRNFRLSTFPNGAQSKASFRFTRSGTTVSRFETNSSVFTTNRIHHVVLTHTFGDAGSTRLYIDGEVVPSSWVNGTGSESPLQNNNPVLIGGEVSGSANSYFAGTIDEPALYKRALTAAEVKLHHDAGKDSPR